MKLKAVIFDADGTLFDTFTMIYDSYVHVADTHHLPRPTEAALKALLGRPIREILLGLFPGTDVEQLFKTSDDYVSQNFLKSKVHEGMLELLDELVAQGLKLAILTSGATRIHSVLQHHGVAEHFTSVVHSERISKHKPNPEGFLLASTECDCQPATMVMVGDMSVDIEVGQRANCLATVGITHGFGSRESLEEAGADYLIDSLVELPALLKTIEHK